MHRSPFVCLLLVIPLLASCAAVVGRGGDDANRAEVLFERLQAEQAAGRLNEAASQAQLIMQNHPSFPRMDEVVFRAGEIARDRGRHAEAARFFETVASDYPASEYRAPSLLAAARAHAAIDMPEDAARALLRLLQEPVEPALRDEATEELRVLVRTRLSAPQLETLVKAFPGSVLSREVALQVARKEYARGNYESAYELLTEYLYRYPEERDAAEARRLLRAASERRGAPRAGEATPVDPNTVGVVLPVTGPGSLYGRHFEQGVSAAVDVHNASSSRRVTLVQADSRGTPVGAVKAVRRLILEDGAVGLVGS
ncbi:MAG: ABC transporter substrate-binding protein, partial [Gemmatimonadales bacterium]